MKIKGKKIKKGWKVIRVAGGSYRSFSVNAYKAERIYRKEEWTSRLKGCGPLAVFETRKRAAYFLHSVKLHEKTLGIDPREYKIVRCEYVKSKDGALWIIGTALFMYQNELPTGTVLADAVRLV